MPRKDLTGQKYGRWRVLRFFRTEPSGKSWYLCRCDCGHERLVVGSRLVSGKSKSCGCWNRESKRKRWLPEKLESYYRVPLTKGAHALIDIEDYEKIKDFGWVLGPNGKYAVAQTPSRVPVRMHRLITGFPPNQVDHRNRNTLDNRKANLRVCTPSENLCNRPATLKNTSGFKGVFFGSTRRKSSTCTGTFI